MLIWKVVQLFYCMARADHRGVYGETDEVMV